MATRRAFLATLLAATSAPALGWAAAGNPAFLACAREADGTFALHGLGADGAGRFAIPLPARGHAGCGHPRRAVAVVFARRPGAYALVIDCALGEVRHGLAPPPNRQLNGHGAFVDDGRLLVTSEQAADTSEGILGLWDGASFERLGEVPTGGLGPHDVRLLPDGRVVVANGGIATDATDRTKLNVGTMRPNLAVLDLAGGIESVELDGLHQASIRHLAVRPDGLVAFAMQWEGPEAVVPLLGLWRPGEAPVLAVAPESEAPLMQGYLGSVAFSGDGAEVVVTSPRGGRAQRFDAGGAFLGSLARAEVCGVAPLGAGVLLSDGLGGLLALEAGLATPLTLAPQAWDNHVVAL